MTEEIEARMAEIETRKKEIAGEIEAPEADLTALEEEVRKLNKERETLSAQLEEIRRKAREDEELRKKIADGIAGEVIDEHETEGKAMDLNEIRSSQEYMEAYAKYIRSNDPRECRALLTTNASEGGQLPVPSIVDDIIRTAWEKNQILNRVRKTYLKGNVKVAFERSADPAYIHNEGAAAITEESLTLGIVTLTPASIKKWIKISDEAVDLKGEAFLRYVYDELTYQIIKKLAADVVGDIATANTSHGDTAVGIPKVAGAPSVTIVPTAAANLSDEAENVVIIMNRLTEAKFIAAQAAGNFSMDPFRGYTVLYTSALKDYDTAENGDVYMIVGDLRGEQVNFPAGEGVDIKWDELSLAESDLVKVVGREYAAHGVTQPGVFVNVVKGSATST